MEGNRIIILAISILDKVGFISYTMYMPSSLKLHLFYIGFDFVLRGLS